MTVLTLADICTGYDGTDVLHHIDLQVDAATIHTIVGPPGAGKSTLIHTIAGLITPSTGMITMDGHDITHLASNLRAQRGMRLVPQRPRLFALLTVQEHLDLAAAGRSEDIATLLADLPTLAAQLTDRPPRLSTADQRLLNLASALLGRPRLLLLDEPATRTPAWPAVITRAVTHGTAVLTATASTDDMHPHAHPISYLRHGRLTATPP